MEKVVLLNNGIEMPNVGIGTFMIEPVDSEMAVEIALKDGYRLIDTANDIQYKYIKDIDKKKLVELFTSVGWKTAEYPNRLYNAIKNSDFVITAWKEDELVGLISTISDGYINVFITYLIIWL